MSESLESLVLEHLRHIRGRLESLNEKVDQLVARMGSVELNISGLRRDIAYHDGTGAEMSVRMDRLAARIERIERRLDIADAP